MRAAVFFVACAAAACVFPARVLAQSDTSTVASPRATNGADTARVATRWSVEAALGAAHNFRTPLSIAQSGESELRIHAQWETRAFEPPLYYAVRAARWTGDLAWALELVHHKIRLVNPPPEVQAFEVSHGYNLLTVIRMRAIGVGFAGAGVGVVIGHPESRVRDLPLGSSGVFGYYITGPAASVLAGARWRITPRWSLHAEGKLTAAQAVLPVARGWSRAPHVGAHVLVGGGWSAGPF